LLRVEAVEEPLELILSNALRRREVLHRECQGLVTRRLLLVRFQGDAGVSSAIPQRACAQRD
jgi:hypothetical protein